MSNSTVGGWSAFSFELTPAVKKVFAEAVANLLGVKYTPFAFATQVVAGTNYSFLSQAQTVVPNAPLRVVKIHIYQPLPNQGGSGEPYVTQIIEINP